MDKILVEVLVPAGNEKFDMFLPQNIKVYKLAKLLSKTLTELSNGMYILKKDSVLCDQLSGQLLDVNMSINEAGLKNGSKLMLV